MLEREIQELIALHPYLLDSDIYGSGRKERTVSRGRIDIDFNTPLGTIIVECKKTSLTNDNILQVRRYIECLKEKGEKIYKAYLIGYKPIRPLNVKLLLQTYPHIVVKELIKSIPLYLKFCRSGHYFDANFRICPYCGNRRFPGKELYIC